MKSITLLTVLAAGLVLSSFSTLATELPPGMEPQPEPVFNTAPAGSWSYGWQGVAGRTYLMEWTTDLVDWRYLPLTEAGAGAKSYGATSSPLGMWLRLRCSDEIPDLAKGGDWQPPLLRIGGRWTALTTTPSGEPAAGVRLSCYRWPATAIAPLTVPLLTGLTGTDGTYVFDSTVLNGGDRVEVRLTGSPNQRIYLPWEPGAETANSVISPGGSGLTVGDLSPDPNPPQQPSFDNPPEDPAPGSLFRFEDYLSVHQSRSLWSSRSVFPSGFHLITEVTESFVGPPSSLIRDTPVDASDWNRAFFVGNSYKTTDGGGVHLSLDAYQTTLSIAFGDPSLKRYVQRNMFVHWAPIGSFDDTEVFGPIPNPVYQPLPPANPVVLEFKDGTSHDLGSDTLPYVADEYPGLETEDYERKLVLGPVPMFVPKAVMGGEPFFYQETATVRLGAELPLGCDLGTSTFHNTTTLESHAVPVQIRWTATISGTDGLQVYLESATLGANVTVIGPGQIVAPARDAGVTARVSNIDPLDPPYTEAFGITIKAEAAIAISEDSGVPVYQYTDLGSFTVPFEYVQQSDATPAALAARQAAELRGAFGNTPEGSDFNGGQRSRSLEPERRIGITGRPAPDSPTFVDALTGRFHHSENDFSLAIPGSDLELSVTRTAAEVAWTNASGLRPCEDPLLAFGPGWNGNLAAVLVRSEPLDSAGMPPPQPATGPGTEPPPPYASCRRLTVRDYQGHAFTFLETKDATGPTVFLPDPTLLPDRATAGITLAPTTSGGYTLTQPLRGLVHTYESATATRKAPNNRQIQDASDGSNPTGFTRTTYHRLASVTDRFGVTLNYHYAATGHLIPETIKVAGRDDALQLRIQQVNGRVTAFWDPAGVKHTYTYDTYHLTTLSRNNVNGDPDPAIQSVLLRHDVGTLVRAAYGYHFGIENDPRPTVMRLPQEGSTTGKTYDIDTNHVALNSIANGNGDTIRVTYQPSLVRQAWSTTGRGYFRPVGDPLLVGKITLPDSSETTFTFLHTLKPGHPSIAARTLPTADPEIPAASPEFSIVTKVTDRTGTKWIYTAGTPVEYLWLRPETSALPTASALVFPSLTRICEDVPNSSVTFTYDAASGFATAATRDAANRATTATYQETYPHSATPYLRPQIGATTRLHDYVNQPTTTADILGHSTTYTYTQAPGTPVHLLPATITDHRTHVTTITRDPATARTTSVQLHATATGDLLSQTDFGYADGLPGLLTTTTRKAAGLGSATDPVWVTDLTTTTEPDDNGFPLRTGQDANADGDLTDPGDLATTTLYSPAGRLLGTTAPGRGTRTTTYDDTGLPNSTCAEDGAVHTLTRDAAGRILLTRNPLGHATGMQYDSLGRPVTAVRDMDGDLAYNPATHALTGIDPGTDIIATTQYLDTDRKILLTSPTGHITARQLDPIGRTTQIIAPANDTPPGTIPTAATGHVTSYQYDLLLSPTQAISITDPLGFETLFKFDDYARLTATLRHYDTANAAKLYSGSFQSYDPDTGLPDTLTITRTPLDADGEPLQSPRQDLITATTHDLLDRPETVTTALGSDSEVLSVTSRTSTGIPWKTAVRTAPEIQGTETAPAVLAQWAVTETEYDPLSRVTRRTFPEVIDALTGQPDNPHSQNIYDPLTGLLAETRDSYDHPVTFGHDLAGRLIWKKDPPVTDAQSGQTGQRPTTIYRYDALGQLVRRVDPIGYAWASEYDPAGRLTITTGPVVRPQDQDPALRQPIWQNQYDLDGNLHQSIDPEGRVTTRTHYPNGTVATITTLVHFTDANGTTTLANIVHRYDRDPAGRLLLLTDGANQSTAFTYDGFGRTLSTTIDPDQPTRARTTTAEYDALLNTALTDPKQQRAEYHYNGAFLPAALNFIDPFSQQAGPDSVTYGRDQLGRLTDIYPTEERLLQASTCGDPSIHRAYDVLGRLVSETSNTVTTAYGYDLDGRPASLATPGRTQTTRYDPAGRPILLTDAAVNIDPVETVFGHDLAGHPVLEETGVLRHTRTYDPVGKLLTHTLSKTSGTTPEELHRTACEYDLLSNLTHLREISPDPAYNRVIDNTYDERNQLVTETAYTGPDLAPVSTTTHRYDAAENRVHTVTTGPGGTLDRDFAYGTSANGLNSNQLHQLTETINSDSPLTTTYGYDANGNRTTRTRASATDTYTWDSLNRLIGQTLTTAGPDNGIWHYGYDPLTRRIARASGTIPDPATAYQFAFSGNSPIQEGRHLADNTWENLIQHTGSGVGGRLRTREPNGSTTYPLHNHRGDLTGQLTSAGAFSWQGQYTADGLLAQATAARPTAYGPNGKWQEPGSLANDGFRYRDLQTGTFLSPDPAGFIDGPNRYNYVGHNPWSAWDPLGLATTIIDIPSDTGAIGYEYLNPSTQNDPEVPALNITIGTVPRIPTMADILPDLDIIAPMIDMQSTFEFYNMLAFVESENSCANLFWQARNWSIEKLESEKASGRYTGKQLALLKRLSQASSDNASDIKLLDEFLDGALFILSFPQPEFVLEGVLVKGGRVLAGFGDDAMRGGMRASEKMGEAAKGLPTATQPNRIYSARELLRRAEESGPFHNFPESFDRQIFESGNRTVTPDFFNKARQGLSNDSIQYRLPGTVNGRDGMFEIFSRPSTSGNTEVIMHRFFNPN